MIGNIYRHYKGNEYKVIAIAKHSETLEDLVVYQDLGNPEKIWVRPRLMFDKPVIIDGVQSARFKLLQ